MRSHLRGNLARVVLLSIAAIVVLTVTAIARPDSSTTDLPDDPLLTPGALDDPGIPELTQEERELTVQLINDPDAVPDGTVSVPELAGDVPYEIESIGVWSTSKDLRKLGAGATVQFSEPITIDAMLPGVVYDESESSFPPYSTGKFEVHEESISALYIEVDLEHKLVIEIAP